MSEKIHNGRTVCTVGTAAEVLGRGENTVRRYWEAGYIEGFKNQHSGWLYLYFDSVLKFRAEERANDAP